MVPFGLRIAWRRAIWPTSLSPEAVKATTDGVVRDPSAFGMTVACPPSIAAMTELVVPRSMPTALAMLCSWIRIVRMVVRAGQIGTCRLAEWGEGRGPAPGGGA